MADTPKIIWLYWHQGEANALEIVRRSIESWRLMNPGWSVQVLDANTVQQATGLSDQFVNHRPDVSLQFLSDVIRTALLARHGGLWADATVFCTQPLDNWLPGMMRSGFFTCAGVRGGRLVESSFLASHPGHVIPIRMLEELIAMFDNRRFTANEASWGLHLRSALKPLLGISPSTTRLWFSPFFTDVLKLYPYFTWHYMFNKLAMEDADFAKAWADTQTLPGWPMIRVKRSRNRPVTTELRQFILSEEVPAHKLNWQAELDSPYWVEVFELFARVQSRYLRA